MSILNGNVLGDVFGEMTCLKYNGASVVDYMITSESVKSQVKSFKVLPMTTFSDHRPILCRLKVPLPDCKDHVLASLYEDVPKRPKWDDASMPSILDAADRLENDIDTILSTEYKSDEDINQLNNLVVNIIKDATGPDGQADENLRPRGRLKKKSQKSRPKQRWYDSECINLKRALNKITIEYGKRPLDPHKRQAFYQTKGVYLKTLKNKKAAYKGKLNSEIIEEGRLTWSKVKDLRSLDKKNTKLDLYDMKSFEKFFTELYKKPSPTMNLPPDTCGNKNSENEILNQEIRESEIKKAVKSLKNGKAAGLDRVLIEHLKAISNSCKLLRLLHKLFNDCLNAGVYPWNTTAITPLLKKGDPYNPDNYRAIAVGSNIGKLFSSILLERLLTFRAMEHPDTPNQLGFKKGAQTVDHIFTINTCFEKYVKKGKKRLHTAFVDFRKAFDSVPRDALLWRLKEIGVTGRFFDCLEYMYKNSNARLKMAGKLSNKIPVETGTEQGHTLSPELFKIYVHSLSERLNNLDNLDCPILDGNVITHLLWADDLVLMALDKQSLQRMLNELEVFCKDWGLEVNIKKTAILIFNVSGKQLIESHTFVYQGKFVPSVKTYCYLGITLSLSGTFTQTQIILKQKAMRAYFALKKQIDLRYISKLAVFKLLDSLIVPIASYGSPVWFPSTKASLVLQSGPINGAECEHKSLNFMKQISSDPIEKLHLSILKWTIGVNKKTSNVAVWGDCGRTPLLISTMKQSISYFNRLRLMDITNSDSIVRHAYREQEKSQLPWFAKMDTVANNLDYNKATQGLPNATLAATRARGRFAEVWNKARMLNRKLDFYNLIKTSFEAEPYTWLDNLQNCHFLARLRTSSHRLNRETGRYIGIVQSSYLAKMCDTCCDKENVRSLMELPGHDPVFEDEIHVLRDCPRYAKIRQSLREPHRTLLENDIPSLFAAEALKGMAWFVTRIFEERFGAKKRIKAPHPRKTT